MTYKLISVPGEGYLSVAEEDGKIYATLKAHLQLHLDHFLIVPDAKCIIDWRKLLHNIEEVEARPKLRLYASPTFKNGPRMLELMGFKLPEYPVMVKEY